MSLPKNITRLKPFLIFLPVSVIFTGLLVYLNFTRQQLLLSQNHNQDLSDQIQQIEQQLLSLQSQDQYQINQQLQSDVKNIKTTYQQTVEAYEDLLKLKQRTAKTEDFDRLFTQILVLLSNQNYASASAVLAQLDQKITSQNQSLDQLASQTTIPASVPQKNDPPGSGYSRQKVKTDVGDFMVSLIAADLSNTKIIVDTASSSDCKNDCPTLSLSDYVSRTGAFAGINGSYFCPASYPSCAGKTNTFDLLLMNKDKVYFNSDNNVYSNNPAVIFGGGYIRFVSAASQWGRDTGIDGVISNFPLLVFNSQIAFGGDDDPKKGSKGNRSFVANRGNTVYIGVVHSATVAESARVLKALSMENGLNLDNGGSTALWSGGYKVGPGRNLPNAILFVRK